MDSFEFNKIIGAVLGACFLVFSAAIVSDAIFAAPAPERPGYAIEAAEPQSGGAAEEAAAVPIATLLASADAAAGETVFRKCSACHSAEKSSPNKVGPGLWGVVDRPIASHEGFAYSAAMREFSQGGSVVWDWEHLNGFLQAPRSYIPGTAMSFAGLKRDDERANLIAYLRTLSDNPAPLPTPEATAPAAENASAPGAAAPAAEGAAPAAAGEAATPAPASDGTTPPAAEGAAPAGEQPAPAGEAAPALPDQPAPLENTDRPQPNATDSNQPAAPAQPAQ